MFGSDSMRAEMSSSADTIWSHDINGMDIEESGSNISSVDTGLESWEIESDGRDSWNGNDVNLNMDNRLECDSSLAVLFGVSADADIVADYTRVYLLHQGLQVQSLYF